MPGPRQALHQYILGVIHQDQKAFRAVRLARTMEKSRQIGFAGMVLAVGLFPSCGAIRKGLSHGLTDGHYRTKAADGARQWVYLDVEPDSLTAYSVTRAETGDLIDTTEGKVYRSGPVLMDGNCGPKRFVKHGIDLDLMYAMLKYRPARSGVPPQFDTGLNGSIYLGYKTERFTLDCVRDPLGRQERVLRMADLDMGAFLGLASTTMNASVTDPSIEIEYTGVALTSGVGIFTRVGNLGFGITCGTDHLLDGYGRQWIYQDRLWLGLSIGVNLN